MELAGLREFEFLEGPVPMANWLNANEEWRLFAGFFENWMTNKPFPRIKGVTL